MRKCKKCGISKQVYDFYTNSNGNLTGSCKMCLTARQKVLYHQTKKARDRERLAQIKQQEKRDKDALAEKRPCSVFPGYLFAGDL